MLTTPRSKSQDKFHLSSRKTRLVDQTEITHNKDYSATREWSLAIQCCAHVLHRQYCTQLQVRVFVSLEQQYVASWIFFPTSSQVHSVPCWLLSSCQKKRFSLNPFCSYCKYLQSIRIPGLSIMEKSAARDGWSRLDKRGMNVVGHPNSDCGKP